MFHLFLSDLLYTRNGQFVNDKLQVMPYEYVPEKAFKPVFNGESFAYPTPPASYLAATQILV